MNWDDMDLYGKVAAIMTGVFVAVAFALIIA